MSKRIVFRASAALLCIAIMQMVGCITDTAAPPPSRMCPHAEQTGPVDAFDPRYRILSPNGGEIFQIGQPCSVKVTSQQYGNATLEIVIGRRSFSLPGLDRSIEMPRESLVVFAVPAYFSVPEYDPVAQQTVMKDYSSISDSCLLKITDYQNGDYVDYSDCYFMIRN
jgi:hypothetical protein